MGHGTDSVTEYLEPSPSPPCCGTLALMVRTSRPTPPAATPLPLSLPQQGKKNPTPAPNASMGVRSIIFNIEEQGARPALRSVPLTLAKAGQASTAPAS